jgi:hypothetical protein
MTISKKLLFVATLGLIMQFNASAYDVVGLKKEVEIITDFANRYNYNMMHNNRILNIGYWLKNKIDSTGVTSNYDIIKIANAINTENTDSVIDKLFALIEKENQKYQEDKHLFFAGIAAICLALGVIVLHDVLIDMIDNRILTSGNLINQIGQPNTNNFKPKSVFSTFWDRITEGDKITPTTKWLS